MISNHCNNYRTTYMEYMYINAFKKIEINVRMELNFFFNIASLTQTFY